ncbi:hypothetical protein [Curtobacterium sp. L1-20]|uniref:DUF7933 domain-containing protein n=1 Tax=Curtobacterium sp. L1-20 TaxID=3138181 RepID=UPI003B51DB59
MNGTGDFRASGQDLSPYYSPTVPAGVVTAQNDCLGLTQSGSRTSTLTFSKPVIAPMIHVINMDASSLRVTGTSTTGAPISLQRAAGNNSLAVSSTVINTTLSQPNNNGCETNTGGNPSGACGSVRLTAASGLVKSVTLFNSTDSSVVANGDGWGYALSFPTAELTKAFSPTTIAPDGVSALTFSITNPASEAQPTLWPLDFTDALPSGVRIANSSATIGSGCGAPTVAGGNGPIAAGDTTVSVVGISVSTGATCTITVNVTGSTPGSYTNNTSNLSTNVANLIPNANTTLTIARTVDTPMIAAPGAAAAAVITLGGLLLHRFRQRGTLR